MNLLDLGIIIILLLVGAARLLSWVISGDLSRRRPGSRPGFCGPLLPEVGPPDFPMGTIPLMAKE